MIKNENTLWGRLNWMRYQLEKGLICVQTKVVRDHTGAITKIERQTIRDGKNGWTVEKGWKEEPVTKEDRMKYGEIREGGS